MFTREECKLWLLNKNVNPRTGRRISSTAVNGVYRNYERCVQLYRLNMKTCDICCNEYEYGMKCENNHEFCKQCVLKAAHLALEQKGEVICFESCCNALFPVDSFDNELRRRLEYKLLLSAIADCEHCTNCDYAVDLPEATEETKIFICPVCLSSHCRLCRNKWFDRHEGFSCTEVADLSTILTKVLTRICPNCKVMIVKDGGCNYMRCTCTEKICYVCRKSIPEGYDHFCRCTNEECTACKLYDNTEAEDLLKIERLTIT